MKLQDTIKGLLSLKREGGYWDFKKEWYDDKGELLLDVLCMANNLEDMDAYIILGVEDSTWSIKGVEADPNRLPLRNLSQIISNKKYAAYAPEVDLQTIYLEEHEIDVIIVRNTMHTPYYLTEQYKDNRVDDPLKAKVVEAGKIYVRLNDRKAGVGEITPYWCLEHLWGKHFGLNQPILKRLSVLLDEPNKWIFDWGNKDYAYHIDHPEFRMQRIGDFEQGWWPAAAFYIHPVMHLAKLNILYHNTIIYETEIWAFDEFRKYLPKATNCCVSGKPNYWYSYYQLDTIEGKMLTIFTNGSMDISSREPNYNQFLTFKDEKERKEFDSYLYEHFEDYTDEQIADEYKHQIAEDTKSNGGGLIYSAFQVAKSAKIYGDWKRMHKS